MKRAGLSLALLLVLGAATWWATVGRPPAPWSPAELALIDSLRIAQLVPGTDATNAVADSDAAAQLGHALFFDHRLSGNGAVSCATCHQPQRRFTDGLPVGRAIGFSQRNTPSLIGARHSPWLYWDGRRDSLWAQALSPLEDPAEHGGARTGYVQLVAGDERYRDAYERVFGPLPFTPEVLLDTGRFPSAASPLGDAAAAAAWQAMAEADRAAVNRVFSNIGKAIAAYEQLLAPGVSRFDRYAAGLAAEADGAGAGALDAREIRGLRLFIGRASCLQCHNGPLFTNNAFHNTGLLSAPGRLPDPGRSAGLRQARADPFNCAGSFSDDSSGCAELEFAREGPENVGAFRTPSLRNLSGTEPYGHAGQLPTLRAVLEQYNTAPTAMIGHNEAKPLGLMPWELRQLEAFLGSLDAPPAVDPRWLAPPPH